MRCEMHGLIMATHKKNWLTCAECIEPISVILNVDYVMYTLENIEKISAALDTPLSVLFEQIETENA